MKKIILIALSLTVLPLMGQAAPYEGYEGCERKLHHLEKQLNYAKYYGNQYRIRGLERAIANVKNRCYDSYSGATGATRLNPEILDRDLEFEKKREIINALIDELKEMN